MAKPTRKQLSYLRHLAEQTGGTFTPPRTTAEASAEIARLKARPRSTRAERQVDREATSRGLEEDVPASSVRPDEVSGYGSSASWA